jgi:MFS transporter, DHA1 family, inner membrane transport protein
MMQAMSRHRTIIISILVLTLTRLIFNMARRFPYPFIPEIGRQLAVPVGSVQSVMATQAGVGVVSPLFGPLSERYGRKRVMLGTLVMMALASLLGALLPQFWIFALVMIAFGAGNMIFLPAAHAFLGDRVPYNRRGMAVGVMELSWAGSLIIAAPVAGFLLATSGLQAVFGALGVAFAVALVIAWFYIPADHPTGQTLPHTVNPLAAFRTLSKSPAGLAAMTFSLTTSAANEIFFINYGLFMELSFDLVLATLGAATTVIAVAEIAGEFAVIGISDRVGKRRLALLGAALASLSYLALPLLAFSLPAALAGLFLMFLGVEMAFVSAIPLFTEVLPGARSVMMSGNMGAASFGRLAGAGLGGLLYGITGSFLLMGFIAMCIGLVGFFMLWRFVHEVEEG